jgi:IMP dehydrogenase
MAYYFEGKSRTFAEYLLIPGFTPKNVTADKVDLRAPITRYKVGSKAEYELQIPFMSAVMQSVTDDKLAHELGKLGGLGFIFAAQSVERQTKMVRNLYAKFKGTEYEKFIGAGINTHDYKERVAALVDAGAKVLCIDSSEGFTEWQSECLEWVHENYGNDIKIGAGNVVDADGFNYLADCGADFVKIGIGGGSICITRETKGIGRGQASAIIDVAAARDAYAQKTGEYVPICSDGGIARDYHITLALAMGADTVMMGKYFAAFDESPTSAVTLDGRTYKQYWGEGSARAQNWERYNQGEFARL